jgi:hypothetical protein
MDASCLLDTNLKPKGYLHDSSSNLNLIS